MNKKLQVATVFSGIGAFEYALKKMRLQYDIVFACDTGERYLKETYEEICEQIARNKIDDLDKYIKDLYDSQKKPNYIKKTYFLNYDITENKWYDDIRFLDGKKYKNKVDILVGGSPCQSFSIIGKKAGLNDARGTLFYDYARLINEIKPKVFIYENVLGMLQHDKGNTWKVIREVFESLGYHLHFDILNSRNYGIPQDRKRLFVVGTREASNFEFPPQFIELRTTMFDYLEDDIPVQHYLGKKGFEFVTNPKNKNRARVDREVIRTEKANQQFNWNGDFVFVPYDKIKNNKKVLERAFLGVYNNEYGAIRQLTHRECFRLMGFGDDFIIDVPNIQAYRQAGNSIVVNVLEEIMKEIIKCNIL